MTLSKIQYQIILILSSLTLIGLPFPVKVSTIGLYLFMLFSIFLIFKSKKVSFKKWFIFLGIFFFSTYCIHFLISDNPAEHAFEVIKKLTFVFVPFLFLNLPIEDSKKFVNQIFLYFSYGLSLVGVALLASAAMSYIDAKDIDVFFYHLLTNLFNGSAIYFSLLFSFSLVISFINYQKSQKYLLLFIGLFNALILLLLSSKIFIFILVSLALFYIIKIARNKTRIAIVFIILLGAIGLINSNNFSSRFSELDLTNFLEIKSEVNTNTSFDGFTLRKELINFGLEIGRTDTQTLWLGVGPGLAQKKLDEKLTRNHFYIGDCSGEVRGFLGYNFHNQYLQTFVETGLIGLFSLVIMLVYLIRIGIKYKNNYLIFFNFIFVISFFTESFLSRQMGVFSFVFFNSISLISVKEDEFNVQFIFKRIFDTLFSLAVILLIMTWLFPVLFIIILFETKSNPIFIQKRVGKDGRYFNCYKLRTMEKNKGSNLESTSYNDQRITNSGTFLRKYGIDELPQFINVLFGQMSVVGPRPLMVVEEIKFSKVIPNFTSRLNVKPGITGLAQSHGYKGYIETDYDLRMRYKLDKAYSIKVTLYKDVKIVLETLKYILSN
jgi:putative colanic acid biosynthesis UDP-glucose lipid carrier transferase